MINNVIDNGKPEVNSEQIVLSDSDLENSKDSEPLNNAEGIDNELSHPDIGPSALDISGKQTSDIPPSALDELATSSGTDIKRGNNDNSPFTSEQSLKYTAYRKMNLDLDLNDDSDIHKQEMDMKGVTEMLDELDDLGKFSSDENYLKSLDTNMKIGPTSEINMESTDHDESEPPSERYDSTSEDSFDDDVTVSRKDTEIGENSKKPVNDQMKNNIPEVDHVSSEKRYIEKHSGNEPGLDASEALNEIRGSVAEIPNAATKLHEHVAVNVHSLNLIDKIGHSTSVIVSYSNTYEDEELRSSLEVLSSLLSDSDTEISPSSVSYHADTLSNSVIVSDHLDDRHLTLTSTSISEDLSASFENEIDFTQSFKLNTESTPVVTTLEIKNDDNGKVTETTMDSNILESDSVSQTEFPQASEVVSNNEPLVGEHTKTGVQKNINENTYLGSHAPEETNQEHGHHPDNFLSHLLKDDVEFRPHDDQLEMDNKNTRHESDTLRKLALDALNEDSIDDNFEIPIDAANIETNETVKILYNSNSDMFQDEVEELLSLGLCRQCVWLH